jgi:hypothetical protein
MIINPSQVDELRWIAQRIRNGEFDIGPETPTLVDMVRLIARQEVANALEARDLLAAAEASQKPAKTGRIVKVYPKVDERPALTRAATVDGSGIFDERGVCIFCLPKRGAVG